MGPETSPEVPSAQAPSPEALVQMLWDIEQIKQLKARYFRLLDTKDWDAFAELFTDDCEHHLPMRVAEARSCTTRSTSPI